MAMKLGISQDAPEKAGVFIGFKFFMGALCIGSVEGAREKPGFDFANPFYLNYTPRLKFK